MKYTFIAILLLGFKVIQSQNLVWSTPIDVSTNAYSNIRPSIDLDGNNNPIVMWSSTDSSAVYISKWNGTNFTNPKRATPNGATLAAAYWHGPNFKVDGNNIYIVYKGSPEETSNLWLARSTDGGNSFINIDVDDTGFVSRFPTVAVNASGNPVVGFMKFDNGWNNARWVTTRSTNGGNSFLPDVLAGNYSGGEACDCCPGSIVSNGNNMAMLYRDNNVNIRDIWAGISTNAGMSFPTGANLDYNNWNIMSCPSSGPEGFMLGDTLYSVFMSQATGKALVYYSAYNFTTNTHAYTTPFTGTFTGLGLQNYPRISNYNNNVATVWKQQVTGSGQILLSFSNQNSGFANMTLDTIIESTNISRYNNPDIILNKDYIYAVWTDNTSKTVKFSYAGLNAPLSVNHINENLIPAIYFAQENNTLYIDADQQTLISITDMNGKIVFQSNLSKGKNQLNLNDLAVSTYVCNIYDTHTLLKSYKIIKH